MKDLKNDSLHATAEKREFMAKLENHAFQGNASLVLTCCSRFLFGFVH